MPSRIPLQVPLAEEHQVEFVSLVTYCITKTELQTTNTADAKLSQVLKYVNEGWPAKSVLSAEFSRYF